MEIRLEFLAKTFSFAASTDNISQALENIKKMLG
jgi:hypothetical protein